MFKIHLIPKGSKIEDAFLDLFATYTDENYLLRRRLIHFLFRFFQRHSVFNESEVGHDIVCVEETKYYSESYVDDLVAYHTLSFKQRDKFCKRVHFFKRTCSAGTLGFHDNSSLESFLLSTSGILSQLSDHYLGYIVIKPIEKFPIGAILAKPWSGKDDHNVLNINSILPEQISFFGIPIDFDALVMQPQDASVSLCTVNAIWCVLHFSWKKFRKSMVSPAKISQKSGISIEDGRMYPIGDRSGFTLKQVCETLKAFDLQPEIYSLKDNNLSTFDCVSQLKKIVYSYNSVVGIPLMLGYHYEGEHGTNDHLVAVTGYEFSQTKTLSGRSYNLRSAQISKLVVHDDQFGPYAAIDIDSTLGASFLSAHELYGNRNFAAQKARPSVLVVALPEVIRIRYEAVEAIVEKFSSVLFPFKIKDKTLAELLPDIEWDIHLTESMALKAYYSKYIREQLSEQNSEVLDKSSERWIKKLGLKIAFSSYPRFLWVARLKAGGESAGNHLMDIIIDPTGSPDGDCIYQMNFSFSFHLTLETIIPTLLASLPQDNTMPYRLFRLIKEELHRNDAKACFDNYHIHSAK
ncbi:MAG: hypothetical protein U0T73_05400 [Chitinophagales bacterium]